MPLLEYRCNDCEQTYDVLHLTRENKNDIVCPTCGSKKHKKLFSAPSVAVGEHSSHHTFPQKNFSGGCCGGGMCGMNN